MSVPLSQDQQHRYLTDAMFHARVEVVARALWEAVCRFDFGHKDPYPYGRLIPETQSDLIAYAIAAVEALEVFGGWTDDSDDASIQSQLHLAPDTGESDEYGQK